MGLSKLSSFQTASFLVAFAGTLCTAGPALLATPLARAQEPYICMSAVNPIDPFEDDYGQVIGWEDDGSTETAIRCMGAEVKVMTSWECSE